jgi:hypothetical protein
LDFSNRLLKALALQWDLERLSASSLRSTVAYFLEKLEELLIHFARPVCQTESLQTNDSFMFRVQQQNCFLPEVDMTRKLSLGQQVSHHPKQNGPRQSDPKGQRQWLTL